jgi:zinc/manganese transport system permease protein
MGLALAVTWVGLTLAFFSVYPVGFFVTSLSFGLYVAVRVVRAIGVRRLPRLVPRQAT